MIFSEFADRCVVVTGGASGIGFAIARAFAQEGAWVVIADVQPQRIDSAVQALQGAPGRVFGVSGDIRKADEVETIVKASLEHLRRIHILVNNAGIYPNCPVLEMPEDEWDAVLDTNLKGTFLMSQAVARHMVTHGIPGHIVSIASGASHSARRGAAHYCASKAGVVMLAKVLAQELAEHRIHVNVVSPGLIDVGSRPDVSPAYRATLLTTIPWGRMGQPDEVASAVLFLCSRRAEYITGAVVEVDGGSRAGRYFLPYSRG